MTNVKNNSIEMKELRKKIDKIDSKILPLMVKRSNIIDIKRINQIKKKISSQSKKLGANPKLITDIWVSIIKNFIEFEKKNFKK